MYLNLNINSELKRWKVIIDVDYFFCFQHEHLNAMILIVGKQDERLLESLILSSSRASVVGPARPDWLEMNPSNRPISHHYLRPISILVSISHNWQVMQNVSEDQDSTTSHMN